MRLLLVLFVLFSLNSRGQSWEESRKKTNDFFNKGDFKSARKSADETLVLAEKEFGKADTAYATSLLEFGMICMANDELSKSNQLLYESLELRKTIFGENSAEYAKVLHEISRLKRTQGDYKYSEKLVLNAIDIVSALGPSQEKLVSDFKSTLGYLHIQKGEYEKGIAIYEHNLALLRADSNTTDDKLWEVLNNLAAVYNMAGKYHKSDPLLMQAVNIYANNPERYNRYAISLSNLGAHYSKLGNYEKAEEQLLKAIDIRLKSNGNKSKEYSTTLSNLAIVYNKMKKFDKAEAYFIEALMLMEQTSGKLNPLYAISLVNLAEFYTSIKQYGKAEPLLLEGLEIRKKILGENHPDYANSLKAIGSVKIETGQDSAGISLVKQAISIYRKTAMTHHPFYISMLGMLTKSYEHIGNLDSAEKYYVEINNLSLDGIQSQFSFQSESEKEKYLKTIIKNHEHFYAFTYKRKNTNDTITRTAYNLLLKTKGALLKSTSALRNSILNGTDTALIYQYQSWINLNKKINTLKTQSLEKRKENLDSLQEKANSLEKKLIAGSNYMAEFNRLSNSSWKGVQASLSDNEAAIEFTQFRTGKDSILYCAMLVKSGIKNPIMIPLFYQKELTVLFDSIRGTDDQKIKFIYGEKTTNKSILFELIWKPIEPHLSSINKIRLSPSGILHKISFAAITDDKGKPLVMKYELDVTSTTAISSSESPFVLEKQDTLSLFGGAEFSINDKSHTPWTYLNGTREEIINLNNAISAKGFQSLMYSETAATEENFRTNAPHCNIVHLATHGFFFPDPEVVAAKAKLNTLKIDSIRFRGGETDAYHEHFINKDPMLRSGIVLAGANDYWNGMIQDEMNNGIVTASEVSTLDLRKIQLAVLSACESGLGDITSVEGVYGLQRAFKMAGTKYLLLSLWKVPDQETAEFMKLFYSNLFKKKNIRKAFRETQKSMCKKYDPFYWGAFVLMD